MNHLEQRFVGHAAGLFARKRAGRPRQPGRDRVDGDTLRTELGGELRTELGSELQMLRIELGAVQSLQTELGGKTRDLQTGLDELRVVGDRRQMLADQRHAEIMGQFENLFSGLREN